MPDAFSIYWHFTKLWYINGLSWRISVATHLGIFSDMSLNSFSTLTDVTMNTIISTCQDQFLHLVMALHTDQFQRLVSLVLHKGRCTCGIRVLHVHSIQFFDKFSHFWNSICFCLKWLACPILLSLQTCCFFFFSYSLASFENFTKYSVRVGSHYTARPACVNV